jgi:hypothetical protein
MYHRLKPRPSGVFQGRNRERIIRRIKTMRDAIDIMVKKQKRSRSRPKGHRHPHLRQDKKSESEVLTSFKELLLNICGLGEESFLIPGTALISGRGSKCILFGLDKDGLNYMER